MTKAYFKDQSPDHALEFFQKGLKSQLLQKEQQDQYLENLYDSTFGIEEIMEEPSIWNHSEPNMPNSFWLERS